MDGIISKIRQLIDRHSLIDKGDRILLSLSAGKDSMLLYHSMKSLRKEYGFEIGIFHLNHLTRGMESELDEEHLAGLARAADIPIFIEHFNFSVNKKKGVSFEEQARDMRYTRANAVSAAHGYNKIATGHSRSDNIETILMRIFTGTGIHGIEGIRPRRQNIIRPLLGLNADEIYSCLTAGGIAWREDASNADASYLRNFVRHEILPLVKSRFPRADESIGVLSDLSYEAIQLLDGFIEEKYQPLYHVSGDDLFIDVEKLIENPPLFRHVVRAGLNRFFNHNANRKMLDEIYSKFTIKKSNISLYMSSVIRADKIFDGQGSRLKVSKNSGPPHDKEEWEYEVRLNAPGGRQDLFLPEIGIRISVEMADYNTFEKFHKNKGYVFVRLENTEKLIYIRNRRVGDRIRTAQGTKKIKDLLIEKKLDGYNKNRVPLLASKSGIIAYMPGLLFDISNRVAADFLIDKKGGEVLAVYKN